jgi:hypothetical protein
VHAASRQAEADTIAAELAAIARTGMVLPGSITQRRTRCGRRNCGCHADPPRLHGPYWQWTRKVAAKTICRWLSDDQHRDYQPWIDNDRRLHALLTRLEALGTAAFEADPRWQQRGRTSPATLTDQADVGTARLTCGQPSSQAPFPQVSPKREHLSVWSSRFSRSHVHVWTRPCRAAVTGQDQGRRAGRFRGYVPRNCVWRLRRVGWPRLTCERTPNGAAFAQVKAKREHLLMHKTSSWRSPGG